jgi:hypothetical protein
MEDIIGFDDQMSGDEIGFLSTLRKKLQPRMPKLPTVTARPNVSNTNLVLTPQEKALVLSMRAKKSGNFFKQIKQAAKPVVTRYKKRNFFGF